MATTTNKIQQAREIILAMQFLGIAPIRFTELKTQHGGTQGLYNFLAAELGA